MTIVCVCRMECVSKWWSGHAAAVMCLAAARAGRGDRLATGSRDHCVRLLDLAPNDTGTLFFVIQCYR